MMNKIQNIVEYIKKFQILMLAYKRTFTHKCQAKSKKDLTHGS